MATPQFALKDVLEVPLLCFEAAADAMPLFRLAYSIPEPTNNLNFPCYRVWSNNDLPHTVPSSSALSSLTFPPETLHAALARWNMCECFSSLLQDEVNRLVRHAFGAKAEWVVTVPVPAAAMLRAGDPGALAVPSHSVIKVTEQNGIAWIMDGTCEQFYWPHDTWLMDYDTFVATRVEDGSIEAVEPWFKDAFENHITWFWEVARRRMESLFDELDYNVLFSKPHHERVEAVRALAKGKFAGTWEEACQLDGIPVDDHS